jgi:hypothetical protein
MKWWSKLKTLRIDGRWFLGGSHISLVIISLYTFQLQRTPLQLGFGVGVALATEFFLASVTKKYSSAIGLDRFLSAFTEAAGILVLLKSHIWWFYGAVSFLAVASKYLLRRDRGSHVFNPTNFAIVAALTFFPLYWFEARGDDFTVTSYPMMHVTFFGILATSFGGTIMVSLAYIASLAFWLFVFFPLHTKADAIYAFGPELGAIGLIYLWLMITDPKTAPASFKNQAVFAFCVAFLHIFLRKHEYLYSRYVALFVVTLVRYAYLALRKTERKPSQVASSPASDGNLGLSNTA